MAGALARHLARTYDTLESIFEAASAYALVGMATVALPAALLNYEYYGGKSRSQRTQEMMDNISASPAGKWNWVAWLRRRGYDTSALPGMQGVDWDDISSPDAT